MNNSVPYLQNNESYNPLYAKMRERFCVNGTIAEKMAIEAGIYKKPSKKAILNERKVSQGTPKKAHSIRKRFFNLKTLGTVSMTLLITGILFFSGASLEGVQDNFMASSRKGKVSYNYIDSDSEHGTLYFADESLPETL